MAGERDVYRGDHLPQVGQDVLALPTLSLRRIALTRVAQLTRGDIQGVPLEALRSSPNLADCRKLYFDETETDVETRLGGRSRRTRAPRWRIVYRLQDPAPGSDTRMRLQVLAVGARRDEAAYAEAGRRLGRAPMPGFRAQQRAEADPQRAPQLYAADHLPQVGGDILALPSLDLQLAAHRVIDALTRNLAAGQTLDRGPANALLPDCRAISISGDDRENPGHRVVYRLQDPAPGSDTRMRLQVLAVGPTAERRVFTDAGMRLNRVPAQDGSPRVVARRGRPDPGRRPAEDPRPGRGVR